MQQTRKILSLRPIDDAARLGPFAQLVDLLRTAIADKQCVSATYNRTEIEFAPHIVYSKREGLFVDGVVTSREGVAPPEAKLGGFKLAGMTGVKLTPTRFETRAVFEPRDPRYLGKTICVIAG